jgi:hypothetical protein
LRSPLIYKCGANLSARLHLGVAIDSNIDVCCGAMKKRRKKIIDVGKEARRAARKSGLAPAVTRVIPDKRKRVPKHKKDWFESEAV